MFTNKKAELSLDVVILVLLLITFLGYMVLSVAIDEGLIYQECRGYSGHLTLDRGTFWSIGEYTVICLDVQENGVIAMKGVKANG